MICRGESRSFVHIRRAIACAVVSSACTNAVAPTGVVVGELVPGAAVDVRIDTGGIGRLVADIRSGVYRDIHSLLIVRRGRIAVEEYFNGSSAEQLHTLQSVSKSVTSALVGIAIANGTLHGVDERIVDFFPQWRDELTRDPRRRVQRIADVLTMRTGTDYAEGWPTSPHDSLNALATGWDYFWLQRPMVTDPGGNWQYDSGGVIALSSLFKARTGQHADSFAATHLFAPLGITGWRWFRNQEGHPHLGGGLFLRARDMAVFGQLYLQRGRWGDRQVVPASWIAASLAEHVRFSPPLRRFTGYGYLWWRLPPAPQAALPMHAALGLRGQHIFVLPEFDAVVVVTAGAVTPEAMNAPVEFLYDHIVPAMGRFD